MERARTFDELEDLLELLFAREQEAYESFRPRPDDVIISPFAKCGTTWMQQIVHALRTGGDKDFDDIYEVVPFIDVAPSLGQDLTAEQRGTPRAFKSHCDWNTVPKGCRYIVPFRHPKDAAVSFFHFMEGWLLEPDVMSIDAFLEHRSFDRDRGADYWRHLASWLQQRGNPDVLLLTFEDMKADLRGVVAQVGEFIGVDADDPRVDVATHESSFESMAANRDRFSQFRLRRFAETELGLPRGGDWTTVRKGAVGDHRQEISRATSERFDEIWAETIQSDFGYPTYGDLVEDLAADRQGRG